MLARFFDLALIKFDLIFIKIFDFGDFLLGFLFAVRQDFRLHLFFFFFMFGVDVYDFRLMNLDLGWLKCGLAGCCKILGIFA